MCTKIPVWMKYEKRDNCLFNNPAPFPAPPRFTFNDKKVANVYGRDLKGGGGLYSEFSVLGSVLFLPLRLSSLLPSECQHKTLKRKERHANDQHRVDLDRGLGSALKFEVCNVTINLETEIGYLQPIRVRLVRRISCT